MRFKSKKDRSIFVIILVDDFLMFIGGLYILFTTVGLMWIIGIGLIAASVITLWMQYTIFYEISDSELIVCCAFIKWRISLNAIEQVTATRDPCSSPALSLDRIRISYRKNGRKKHLLVSPENKTDFLQAIIRRNVKVK